MCRALMHVHADRRYAYIAGILQLCHVLVPALHSLLQAHALLVCLHTGRIHRVPMVLQLERDTAAEEAVRAFTS